MPKLINYNIMGLFQSSFKIKLDMEPDVFLNKIKENKVLWSEIAWPSEVVFSSNWKIINGKDDIQIVFNKSTDHGISNIKANITSLNNEYYLSVKIYPTLIYNIVLIGIYGFIITGYITNYIKYKGTSDCIGSMAIMTLGLLGVSIIFLWIKTSQKRKLKKMIISWINKSS